MSTKLEQAFLSVKKIAHEDYSYCDPKTKNLMHNRGKRFLCLLAETLGLQQVTISSNKAGVAVSGEVSLISATLYCQLSGSCMYDSLFYLVRGVKGSKDYAGLVNMEVKADATLDDLLDRCHQAQRDSKHWKEGQPA